MYNAYIPRSDDYRPVEEPPHGDGRKSGGPSPFQDFFGGTGQKNAGLAGILKAFNLDRLDKGDLLLILLILCLLWEGKDDGENRELLLILGLALFLGL